MAITGQFPQLTQWESTTPDIIGLYRCESNANATVGNNYTLTHLGAGGSYNFNNYVKFNKGFYAERSSGDGYYFFNGYDSNIDWSNTKTWMCWFKRKASSTTECKLWGTTDGGQTIFVATVASGGTVSISFSDGAGSSSSVSSNGTWVNLRDDELHQIAFVNESSTSHKLYIDGILHDTSTANISVPSGDGPIKEMSIWADGYAGDKPLDGYGDEFAIFNRAFTANEMYAHGGALAH